MDKFSRTFFLGLFIILLVAGCDRVSAGGKFSLVSSPTGNVYRLNSQTGEIRKVHGSVLVLVSETGRIEMVVGNVYVMEDGSQMEYLGAGQFKLFEDDTLTLQEYLEIVREE